MRKNRIQKFTWLINKNDQQSITDINWRLKILQKCNNNHTVESTKKNSINQESNPKNEVFWTIYKKNLIN